MPRFNFVRVALLATVLWLAATTAARAQESAPPMHATGLSGGVFRFANDLGRDFTSQAAYPFHLARNDPWLFAAGAGLFAGLVATDRATHDAVASPEFIHEHHLEGPTSWMSGMTSPSHVLPVAVGVGVISAFGPEHERQTGLMLTEALITSGVWTGALKFMSGRERPRETSETVADWTGPAAVFSSEPTGSHSLRSFPSGHTSSAFAAATVLAHQYPSHGIVPVIAYGAAVAMGYSRMAVGAHWLSDVAVGGLVGYGCARQVISAREDRALRSDRDTGTGWHLCLELGGETRAAGLLFQF